MLQTRLSIPTISRTLIDVYIRFGLILLLAISCFEIFKPFISLMAWSVILAITLYPLQTYLRGKIFDGEGRTATLIVFLVICIILVPSCLLGIALIDSVEHALEIARSGNIRIPPPSESVAAGRLWASNSTASGTLPPPTSPRWLKSWRHRSRWWPWRCSARRVAWASGC
jgi:predicted PurR-regulated permease PerM